ncbi:hypothetical protein PHYPSEUDO_009646 [Phytophthora pseudosyringae]|uniref:Isochorismatase-like domain-containing protein n=1 Tax=Phytophthora pseudosyringae TaxID=221518 RepID=A0A8T1WH38_9STRA|nr:hypothetical protein PHYPSEUDO_009646 [Phytophthora pseudosyringae]
MFAFKLAYVASCVAILAAPVTSTVYISTPPNNCNAYDENDVDTSACLANKINQGGLGLLVIDQQVSFHPGGSLAIATANEDAARIAAFLSNHSSELDQVVLTMDSHQRYHIAHGIFWQNATGDPPELYTTIHAQNISDGVWMPRDASLHDYVLTYTQSLEASGKFSLTVWPEHCLIGSHGHNIVSDVLDAALEWTKQSLKPIEYVMKGSNPFTEHYSALRAEYELPYDPSTSLNTELIKTLQRSSKLVIVGEALSHCVNFTVRDLVDNWPAERLSDLIILTDCSSPVAGYEAEAEVRLQSGGVCEGAASRRLTSSCLPRRLTQEFLSDMAALGLTLTTSAEFYA